MKLSNNKHLTTMMKLAELAEMGVSRSSLTTTFPHLSASITAVGKLGVFQKNLKVSKKSKGELKRNTQFSFYADLFIKYYLRLSKKSLPIMSIDIDVFHDTCNIFYTHHPLATCTEHNKVPFQVGNALYVMQDLVAGHITGDRCVAVRSDGKRKQICNDTYYANSGSVSQSCPFCKLVARAPKAFKVG